MLAHPLPFQSLRQDILVNVYGHHGLLEARDNARTGYVSLPCMSFADWQASSMAQNALGQVFSAVGHLTLEHTHSQSSEEHNTVDHAKWRKLLRSFSNVKTLRANDRLIDGLSRCLQLDEGELPLDLLPELHEFTYHSGDVSRSFHAAYQEEN
jgi:hypothetical protein